MKLCNFLLVTLALSLISCNSTNNVDKNQNSLKESSKANEKSTFVNTRFTENEKIYTTMIFSRLDYIGTIKIQPNNSYGNFSKETSREVSKKNYEYNLETGEVVLKKKSDMNVNNAFHIIGTYDKPLTFVLPGNICKTPLVMFKGKRLVQNVDYDYQTSTSKIILKDNYDLDLDSYAIYWYTKLRECVFSNDFSKYQEFYEKTRDKWYKEQE